VSKEKVSDAIKSSVPTGANGTTAVFYGPSNQKPIGVGGCWTCIGVVIKCPGLKGVRNLLAPRRAGDGGVRDILVIFRDSRPVAARGDAAPYMAQGRRPLVLLDASTKPA